jgi:hypothetical protein
LSCTAAWPSPSGPRRCRISDYDFFCATPTGRAFGIVKRARKAVPLILGRTGGEVGVVGSRASCGEARSEERRGLGTAPPMGFPRGCGARSVERRDAAKFAAAKRASPAAMRWPPDAVNAADGWRSSAIEAHVKLASCPAVSARSCAAVHAWQGGGVNAGESRAPRAPNGRRVAAYLFGRRGRRVMHQPEKNIGQIGLVDFSRGSWARLS